MADHFNIISKNNFHKQNISGYSFFMMLVFLPLFLGGQEDLAFLPGDPLPDAPALSKRGDYKVGVQTIEVVHHDQVDILNTTDSNSVYYDRSLKLEVWYPAQLDDDQIELVQYEQVLGSANDPRRPIIPFTFSGRAARDAPMVKSDAPFPLIVVSHGYTGSRLLMTYLTENLASKGYVVVAIDHRESTYADAAGFQSTLLNRPKDILFVINEIAALNLEQDHFLSGMVDVDHTAIIGYSMGGYGVLNVGGAGYSQQLLTFFGTMTGGNKSIASLTADHENFGANFDPRIKAIVAFAPWGMERGVWDLEGLKGLKLPTFFIAGSEDDISGYEKGVKTIFEGAINADRHMLTYFNARHNVAPNPPPAAALKPGLHFDEYYRYAEPAWDQRRMNNINQHFITAFLGIHLKNLDFDEFLEVEHEESNEKTWPGFQDRTSTGLGLYFKPKAE